MKENESALFSRYIIDGILQDATPYELLSECLAEQDEDPIEPEGYTDILDESTDPPISSFTYNPKDSDSYIRQISTFEGERSFRMLYPETFTRQRIAKALIDRIWNKGHFKLGNLRIWAEWEWNSKPLGNMAAFYRSVQATSEYTYDLGCRIEGWTYDGCDEACSFKVGAWIPDVSGSNEEEDMFKTSPFESRHAWIEEDRCCPDTMLPDTDTRLIYIPFDTSSLRLGGSLLAELNGHNGGAGPHIQDPDYFIDCFEVVRELAEDGFIMSGTAVADGGLAKALVAICGEYGVEACINGIMSSYMEDDRTKVLFSEIPGIIIQVHESDMDYLDSQLLLQDVAYYPVGRPSVSFKGVRMAGNPEITVAGILASLIDMASEGED